MKPSALRAGPGEREKADEAAEAAVRAWVARAVAAEPLPSTRSWGERLGCANTTVFRVLVRLRLEGVLWQHPVNGRFYPAAARATLDRPRPLACLVRRLELCSALYREFLEGISAGCGDTRRTMLLWHDELLVNHPDPALAPSFAAPVEQRAILRTFLAHHGEYAGGHVLDHVWSDEALRDAGRRMSPAVLLYRRAPKGLEIGNARADFALAATHALAHLLVRGFMRICPVRPFRDDPAVEEFFDELRRAATALGCGDRLAEPVGLEELASMRGGRPRARCGWVVPEDHTALRLHAEWRERGVVFPRDAGLLAVMGTSVGAGSPISRIGFDFRAMGRAAVRLIETGGSEVFPGVLEARETT